MTPTQSYGQMTPLIASVLLASSSAFPLGVQWAKSVVHKEEAPVGFPVQGCVQYITTQTSALMMEC